MQQGREAYLAGKPLSWNPYDVSSTKGSDGPMDGGRRISLVYKERFLYE
jgi:hypothetical protein